MRLGEKIRYLREVEGALRGMDREMTQQELANAIRREAGQSISQSYLSQIESRVTAAPHEPDAAAAGGGFSGAPGLSALTIPTATTSTSPPTFA